MMMMMALRMKSSFFRSIVRERENKRVVWGVNEGAHSDVFFSTKHTHKHINTRNISRNNDNALVKGEKI